MKRRRWFTIDNEIDWDHLSENLKRHRAELVQAKQELDGLGQTAAFELGITDLITEKAVDHLSRRSTVYYRSAWMLLLGTAAAISLAVWWFEVHTIANFIGETKSFYGFTNTQVTVMFLIRSVTMGALFAAGPAILGGLSFSYFHEATAAYHQRHMIRFGRLWVELQLSGNQPVKPTLRDFKQAFGLEGQPVTSFRRLRMPKSVTGETADVVKSLVAALKDPTNEKEAALK